MFVLNWFRYNNEDWKECTQGIGQPQGPFLKPKYCSKNQSLFFRFKLLVGNLLDKKSSFINFFLSSPKKPFYSTKRTPKWKTKNRARPIFVKKAAKLVSQFYVKMLITFQQRETSVHWWVRNSFLSRNRFIRSWG